MTTRIGLTTVLSALGAVAMSGMAMAQDVSAGRAVAQRYCATCHHIADGESPLEAAPPFASLKDRYGAGGLAELLEKGMIKDRPRPLQAGKRGPVLGPDIARADLQSAGIANGDDATGKGLLG